VSLIGAFAQRPVSNDLFDTISTTRGLTWTGFSEPPGTHSFGIAAQKPFWLRLENSSYQSHNVNAKDGFQLLSASGVTKDCIPVTMSTVDKLQPQWGPNNASYGQSTPASELLTQAGSINPYTSPIEIENHLNYVNGNESGDLDPALYEGQYRYSLMDWSKIEYSGSQDFPSISSLPIPPYNRRS
jgi:hypothetical protein